MPTVSYPGIASNSSGTWWMSIGFFSQRGRVGSPGINHVERRRRYRRQRSKELNRSFTTVRLQRGESVYVPGVIEEFLGALERLATCTPMRRGLGRPLCRHITIDVLLIYNSCSWCANCPQPGVEFDRRRTQTAERDCRLLETVEQRQRDASIPARQRAEPSEERPGRVGCRPLLRESLVAPERRSRGRRNRALRWQTARRRRY